jgi:hypothetical protein
MSLFKKTKDSNELSDNQNAISKNCLSVSIENLRKVEFLHSKNVKYIIQQFSSEKIKVDIDNANIQFHETIEAKIDLSFIVKTILAEGIKKVENIHFNKEISFENNTNVEAYGDKEFAIIIESEQGILSHLWIAGNTDKSKLRRKLQNVFINFGNKFDLFVIHRIMPRFFFLYGPDDVIEFIRYCC